MRKNITQIMLGVLAGFEGSLGVELFRVLDLSGEMQIIIFLALMMVFFLVLYTVIAMHSSKKVKEQVVSDVKESVRGPGGGMWGNSQSRVRKSMIWGFTISALRLSSRWSAPGTMESSALGRPR
ncbi:MAG: hypothetical protein ACLFUV_07715 [Methanomassiliicoccales archaeon]